MTWTETRLKFMCQDSGQYGLNIAADHYAASGTRLIRTSDITADGALTPQEDGVYVDLELDERHRIQRGDILLSRSGTLGRALLVPAEAEQHTFAGFLIRFRPKSATEPRFLYYATQSLRFQEIVKSEAVSSTIQNFNAERYANIPLTVPRRDEQRRIANFLDAETSRIDAIDNRRRTQIDVLQERYSVAVSELVTPGISSAHIRSRQWPWLPALIPAARLGYMARIQSGVTVHAGRSTTARDGEFPYLRVANVQNEHIDLTEVKTIRVSQDMADAATLHPGDVVMTEANGNPDNLGRGAIWDGAIENMIHQNHVFAIRTDRTKLIPEYLVALLSSIHGRRYFRLTSTQVGIATTSSSKVLGFPIPLRTLPEQEGVVTEYRLLRENAAKATQLLDRQRSLLAERRQALITAAVTGQFDVSTASGRNTTQGV